MQIPFITRLLQCTMAAALIGSGIQAGPITLQHDRNVVSIAVLETTQGIIIVTGSLDRTAKIWNMYGDCLATLQHDDWVRSVAVLETAQGVVIVTGSFDHTAKVWNLGGSCLATLQHKNLVWSVAALETAQGAVIVTGSSDGTAKIWNMKGTCLATLQHNNSVWSVAALETPLGTVIVTVSEGNAAKLWNVDLEEKVLPVQKDCLATLKHDARVKSVAALKTPLGAVIITGAQDGTAKLWSYEDLCKKMFVELALRAKLQNSEV